MSEQPANLKRPVKGDSALLQKKSLSAKEVVTDIRAGATDEFLKKKYGLSEKGLESLFHGLITAKVVTPADLHRRASAVEVVEAIIKEENKIEKNEAKPIHSTSTQTVFTCPACKMPQNKAFDICPQCGVVVSKFRRTPPLTEDMKQQVAKSFGKDQTSSSHPSSISSTSSTFFLNRDEDVTVRSVITGLGISLIGILALMMLFMSSDSSRSRSVPSQQAQSAPKEDVASQFQAEAEAETQIADRMKDPSSARFQETVARPTEDPNVWIVTGYVTATNSFNAKIRQAYGARLIYHGQHQWSMTDLILK